MWPSEKAQCEVIHELLKRVRLEHLWTPTGPTSVACRLLEAGGGPLSHGEAVMLRVAFDIWDGHGKAEVGELLATLDERNLHAVTEAILARDAR